VREAHGVSLRQPDFAGDLDSADEMWEHVYLSEDGQEGPRAFREKRKPSWTASSEVRSPTMTTQTLPGRDAEPNLASYEEARATFGLGLTDTYNPVHDIVERWAQEAPDDLALVSLDGAGEVVAEHTVADLAHESRRAARALLEAGVGKGDRVFIMLPRVPPGTSRCSGHPDRRGRHAGAEPADPARHRLPDRQRSGGRRSDASGAGCPSSSTTSTVQPASAGPSIRADRIAR